MLTIKDISKVCPREEFESLSHCGCDLSFLEDILCLIVKMSVVVQLKTWFLLIYVINLSKNQFRDILFKLLHVALLLKW